MDVGHRGWRHGHPFPSEPVARVDYEVTHGPLIVEEKIVDVSDSPIECVDMKAGDLTGLVKHETVGRNLIASLTGQRCWRLSRQMLVSTRGVSISAVSTDRRERRRSFNRHIQLVNSTQAPHGARKIS